VFCCDKIRLILLPALVFIIAAGCSKDSDENNPLNTAPPRDGALWVHLADDSVRVPFAGLPRIDVDGEEAILLSEFIDTSIIPMFEDKGGKLYDARILYAYEIMGEDGFSPSGTRGYPDNVWEHLSLGYILTSAQRVVFPDDKIDLPGGYNVKDAARIYVHRKFDVKAVDTIDFRECRDMVTVQVTNPDGDPEQAIALKDLILPLVAEPGSHAYNLRTLDDFGPSTDLTWEEFQTGYWLLSSQKTMFTAPGLTGGKYRLKVLHRILVK